ncbi:MAG: hypothetical protein JW703_05110 [Candidatus Diapherotrites archaeon]|nr:hypothetical protein [Candidatus Diapherotrites archaeon]
MSEEKKTNLWLIAGIIILAGILVYFIFFNAPAKGQENIEQTYNIDGTEIEGTPYYYEDLSDVDLNDFIPETIWTLNDCDAMDSIESKNECIKAVAVSTGNESTCEKINDIDLKNLCYIDLAYYYERIELCNKSIESKSECALDLAIKTNDAKYCEKTDWEKQICKQAAMQKNEDMCYTIGIGRQECRTAVSTGNASACDSIESFKESCYYYLAIKNNNSFLCEKISENRDTCFFRVALNTESIETCKKMNENSDNCIAWIAINTNNINLCYQAGTEQESCIEDVQYLNS